MKQAARENSKDNDLFYLCGLIDYIARKTKNRRSDVVNKLGHCHSVPNMSLHSVGNFRVIFHSLHKLGWIFCIVNFHAFRNAMQ